VFFAADRKIAVSQFGKRRVIHRLHVQVLVGDPRPYCDKIGENDLVTAMDFNPINVWSDVAVNRDWIRELFPWFLFCQPRFRIILGPTHFPRASVRGQPFVGRLDQPPGEETYCSCLVVPKARRAILLLATYASSSSLSSSTLIHGATAVSIGGIDRRLTIRFAKDPVYLSPKTNVAQT